jgi:hypothetical protein
MASNTWNTMKEFLKGGHTYNSIAARAKGSSAVMAGVRGFAEEHGATMLSDAGRAAFHSDKGFFAGIKNGLKGLGPDSFQSGYLKRLGWGAGMGATAGGGRAYYNDDGPGGYAKNVIGGAALGAVGSHMFSMGRTKGTTLNSLLSSNDSKGNAFKQAWRARNG